MKRKQARIPRHSYKCLHQNEICKIEMKKCEHKTKMEEIWWQMITTELRPIYLQMNLHHRESNSMMRKPLIAIMQHRRHNPKGASLERNWASRILLHSKLSLKKWTRGRRHKLRVTWDQRWARFWKGGGILLEPQVQLLALCREPTLMNCLKMIKIIKIY
jgi:hypothetical protein